MISIRQKLIRRVGVAVAAALLGGLGAATAAPLDKPAPAAPAGLGASGSYAAIDPATGQMRQPTAEELRFLAEAFRALFETEDKTAVTETLYADGSASASLPDGLGHALIARLDAAGHVAGACVDNADAAAAVFLVPMPPAFEER